MKIKISRKLENKVYTSTFTRVIAHDDPDKEQEARMENDFGPIEIRIGGVIEAAIKMDSGSPVISDEDEDEKNIRFTVKDAVVALTDRATFSYSCDAKNEVAEEDMSVLQKAEAKCIAYEAEIRKRVKEAVEKWKAQKTDFEITQPEDIIESLI